MEPVGGGENWTAILGAAVQVIAWGIAFRIAVRPVQETILQVKGPGAGSGHPLLDLLAAQLASSKSGEAEKPKEEEVKRD